MVAALCKIIERQSEILHLVSGCPKDAAAAALSEVRAGQGSWPCHRTKRGLGLEPFQHALRGLAPRAQSRAPITPTMMTHATNKNHPCRPSRPRWYDTRAAAPLAPQFNSGRRASDELDEDSRSEPKTHKHPSGLVEEALTAASQLISGGHPQPEYGAASGSPEAIKKRRRRPKNNDKNAATEGAVRQCTICGATNTPKWRFGAWLPQRAHHGPPHPPALTRQPLCTHLTHARADGREQCQRTPHPARARSHRPLSRPQVSPPSAQAPARDPASPHASPARPLP